MNINVKIKGFHFELPVDSSIGESAPVIVERAKIITSILLAVMLAFSGYGLSIVFFPNQEPTPMPGPEVATFDQIFSAIVWIGLAAVCAVAIVGAILLINRVWPKEAPYEDDVNILCSSGN